MMLALCASVQFNRAADLEVSPSIGDEAGTAVAESVAAQGSVRKSVSVAGGVIYPFASVNTTNISVWVQQRANALQGTRAGGIVVGSGLATFAPLPQGQLGEPWMFRVTEGGGGFELRGAFKFVSPTPFRSAGTELEISSSDPGNVMGFKFVSPGLSVSRIGTDANGTTYTSGDPLITELVGSGIANSSRDTLEKIQQFIEEKRPWSVTFTVRVPGFASFTRRVDFNLPFNPQPTITSFYATTIGVNTVTVAQGASVILTWNVLNATTSITLNGSAVTASGTLTVTPAQTTTYTLVATSPGGPVQSHVTVIVVPSPPPIPPPVADFIASWIPGQSPGLTVQLTDRSKGTIVARNWDFGNGSGSSVQNPVVTFGATGNYSVTLTVTDSNGKTSSLTQPISVTAPTPVQPSPAPVLAFNITASSDVTPEGDVFSNTQLTLTGVAFNDGNAPYTGPLILTWQYKVVFIDSKGVVTSEGSWVDFPFQGSAGSYSSITLPAKGKVEALQRIWNAGPANPSVRFLFRLHVVADKNYSSEETVRVVNPPPQVTGQTHTQAMLRIVLVSVSPGATHEIQTTSTPSVPSSWVTVGTVRNDGNTQVISVSDSSKLQNFFRTRAPQ